MANAGAAATGALGGAGTGAMVGSVVPGIGTAIGAVGGAVIGGLAGLFSSDSSGDNLSGMNLAGASPFEQYGQNSWYGNTQALQGLVDAGPGQGDVSSAYGAQTDLASMLQQYAQGGYQPTQSDINSSNSLAQSLFAPQQAALNNSYQQQNVDFQRQAALMGRSGTDPVLAAKLAQYQGQQQSVLSAQQGAFASQNAMQQPMQRLDFAQQRTGILSGLATQAMANRQALAGMGQGIMNNQQQFRVQTAQHYGNSQQSSGGGLGGALQGTLAGAGTGAAVASYFKNTPNYGNGSPFSGAGNGMGGTTGMSGISDMGGGLGGYGGMSGSLA